MELSATGCLRQGSCAAGSAAEAAGVGEGKEELPSAGKKRAAGSVAEVGEVADGHVEKEAKRMRRADDADGREAAGPECPAGAGGGSAEPDDAAAGVGEGSEEPEDEPAGLAGGSAGEGDSSGKGKGKGKGRRRARLVRCKLTQRELERAGVCAYTGPCPNHALIIRYAVPNSTISMCLTALRIAMVCFTLACAPTMPSNHSCRQVTPYFFCAKFCHTPGVPVVQMVVASRTNEFDSLCGRTTIPPGIPEKVPLT